MAAGGALLFVRRPSSVRVEADAEGFFAGSDVGPEAELFPGRGVLFAFRADDAIVGRLAAGVTEASFWRRDADGALREVEVQIEGAVSEHRTRAMRGLAHFPGTAEGTTARFAETWSSGSAAVDQVGEFAGVERQAGVSRPLEAGLELAAWSPQDAVFVRFRSVEAAYRVVSEADNLASSLLSDSRDYGTVRLTLHDLLLPTIWRTNPDAERGVSEVGLVLVPPFRRGRLRAAVVFRVIDPELHRMQTQAGVAQEAAEDHIWRPSDDPFPEERTRRNFRRVVADVEIVATDDELSREIAEGRHARMSDDPEYRAARGDPPKPDEACFAFVPASMRSWILPENDWTHDEQRREWRGLRSLAEKWVGQDYAHLPWVPMVAGSFLRLTSLRFIRVTTDAKGAAVAVAIAREDSGPLLGRAAIRESVAFRERDRMDQCLRNLADLVPLALVENPQDDVAERNFVVLGWKPVCPCGGTYAVHPITREVSCSAHGMVKAPRTAKWKPRPVSDVKQDGAELSFRLAIDWNRKQ